MPTPKGQLTKKELTRLANLRHRDYKREWARKKAARLKGVKYIPGLGKRRATPEYQNINQRIEGPRCNECEILLTSKYTGKGDGELCGDCLG